MPATVRRTLPAVFLALALFVPESGGAQEADLPATPAARAFVDAGARLSTLRSSRVVLLGGSLGFDLGAGPRFGVGGWLLTDPVDLDPSRPASGLRLRVAYGGVLSEWPVTTAGPLAASAQILLGAGNAKLELPAVGAEIAADNFAVLEPGLSLDLRLTPWLGLSGGVAWRWAWGVEDLPGLGREDLRGASGTLGLRLGPA